MGSLCGKGNFDTAKTVALRRAAGCGDTKRLENLLRKGTNVNISDSSGNTALIQATKGGWVNCVKILVKSGADVNTRDIHGHTALMVAGSKGNVDCVKVLTQAGADVNVSDRYGYTALMRAGQQCEQYTEELTQCLVNAGADVNGVNMYGDNALHVALTQSNYMFVNTLLKAGADVNNITEKGKTALMAAVEACDLQLDVYKKYNMFSSKINCVRLVLNAGVQINRKDCYNHNALQHYLAQCECIDRDVFMLLFAAGETLEGTSVENIVFAYNKESNNNDEVIDLPTNFNLKDLSRQAIRKHFLDLKPNSHLFHRIPKLPLPPLIKSYLLYNVMLECD